MKKNINDGTLEMRDGYIIFTGNETHRKSLAIFECNSKDTFNRINSLDDFLYYQDKFNKLQDAICEANGYKDLFNKLMSRNQEIIS